MEFLINEEQFDYEILVVAVFHTVLDPFPPQVGKLLDVPPTTQTKCFKWNHIMLMSRSTGVGSRVRSRIDDFELGF